MNQSMKLAQVGKECVACGCCAAVCPRAAIRIGYGIIARIDALKCVGCGKCAKACPAAVITLEARRVTA